MTLLKMSQFFKKKKKKRRAKNVKWMSIHKGKAMFDTCFEEHLLAKNFKPTTLTYFQTIKSFKRSKGSKMEMMK